MAAKDQGRFFKRTIGPAPSTTRSRAWVHQLEAAALALANFDEAVDRETGRCRFCGTDGKCLRDCPWLFSLIVTQTLIDEAREEDLIRTHKKIYLTVSKQ